MKKLELFVHLLEKKRKNNKKKDMQKIKIDLQIF